MRPDQKRYRLPAHFRSPRRVVPVYSRTSPPSPNRPQPPHLVAEQRPALREILVALPRKDNLHPTTRPRFPPRHPSDPPSNNRLKTHLARPKWLIPQRETVAHHRPALPSPRTPCPSKKLRSPQNCCGLEGFKPAQIFGRRHSGCACHLWRTAPGE